MKIGLREDKRNFILQEVRFLLTFTGYYHYHAFGFSYSAYESVDGV